MGCTASKLDNEDTVRRCKERRRLIKDAVFARHHLAAAHSDYCRSLRITGSALSDFASGEPLLLVSPSTPSVLLHPHTHPPPSPTPSFQPPSLSPTPSFKPPPPIRVAPPAKSSSSPTIATSDLPHILSGSSGPSLRKKERAPKLPHILSDTSVPATPQTGVRYEGVFAASSNYDSTPSQASSVWNWENFYPPSPPGSDFFARPGPGNESKRGYGDGDGDDGGGGGGGEREREEVHCSEWGDHYATTSATSSSETDDDDDVDGGEDGDGTNAGDGDDERETRSEISELPTSRSGFGPARTPSVRSKVGWGLGKLDERYDDEEGMRWKSGKQVSGGGSGSEEMRIVVRHKDLKEIVLSLKDYFDMAATAGDQVSEMLETGRAQLDRSFRQLKKTVYHSSGVLSSLSSSWSSKPPLAVKYRLDATALDEPGGPKSLCSTLERLLAWEKKLYEEVKAREGVKIEHEKKLATLQSQEYKGEDEIKLDKTKASLKKLQSLIIVTSQAVNTTSSAIVGLRDSDLVPQIVELCHGMMYMWKSMNQFHELQNQIVQQVRGLINQQVKGDSTSELHRQATRELESAISAWHSSFCRLIKYQRDFIRSLHGWFKLTLLPVEKEATTHMMREPSDSFAFVEEWKLALDRLPDTVASEAIKSFVNVVHVISVKQSEEFKVKKRTETVSKELEKKASALRNIEKKYYHSYSMVGVGFPDTGPDNGLALDARDPLAEKKSELSACQRRVEEEIMKHAKAVEVTRAMTLNNIQTGLPGVFQALTSFSSLFMEALAAACTRSYSIK